MQGNYEGEYDFPTLQQTSILYVCSYSRCFGFHVSVPQSRCLSTTGTGGDPNTNSENRCLSIKEPHDSRSPGAGASVALPVTAKRPDAVRFRLFDDVVHTQVVRRLWGSDGGGATVDFGDAAAMAAAMRC